MNSARHLFVIDPQNDFCDLPAASCPPGVLPALPVTGGNADMQRLAHLIDTVGYAFDAISLTLDSHQRIDIGHPTFWRQADGSPVAPFTQVLADDVRAGRIVPRMPDARAKVIDYLEQLEAAGRYIHMVWPVHCEIGSWGHNIHPDVLEACERWEDATLRNTDKIVKGTNPWTEHYSAIMAEVPLANDVATGRNERLLDTLAQAEEIFIAGEAASHCVKATVEHLVEYLGDARRLVLIEDCMSPVTGFAAQATAFLAAMRERGAHCMTARDATAILA